MEEKILFISASAKPWQVSNYLFLFFLFSKRRPGKKSGPFQTKSRPLKQALRSRLFNIASNSPWLSLFSAQRLHSPSVRFGCAWCGPCRLRALGGLTPEGLCCGGQAWKETSGLPQPISLSSTTVNQGGHCTQHAFLITVITSSDPGLTSTNATTSRLGFH